MRVMRSVPEEKHAKQNYRGENCIPDKVHPMDALTATIIMSFVLSGNRPRSPVLQASADNNS